MSGAASIAAAKNRRTKADPNQKPIISCSSKSGSCPLPGGNKITSTPRLIDEESLQIKGPMHLMQVLQVHEQRLNKIDDKISRQAAISPQAVVTAPQACIQEEGQACDAECYDRISALEEKVQMLEEVIMNLQLTLTNVQSFTMETSLAMLKLQNQVSATPAPAVVSAPATPATTMHVHATTTHLPSVESAPPAESSED
jgi:hypothetical protein